MPVIFNPIYLRRTARTHTSYCNIHTSELKNESRKICAFCKANRDYHTVFSLGWSVVACSPAKGSSERIVAAYFDVVEHSFSAEYEENVLILEDRIVASFVVYPEDDIEAFSSVLTPEVLSEHNRLLPERRLEIYDFDGNLIHRIALDDILVPTDTSPILLESPAGGFCVFSPYTELDSSDASCQLAYFSDTGTHVKTQTITIDRNDLNFVDSACILPNGKLCVLGTTANWTSQLYIFSEKGRAEHSISTKEFLFQGNLLLINEQLYLYASMVREELPRGALFSIDTASEKSVSQHFFQWNIRLMLLY